MLRTVFTVNPMLKSKVLPIAIYTENTTALMTEGEK